MARTDNSGGDILAGMESARFAYCTTEDGVRIAYLWVGGRGAAACNPIPSSSRSS